MSAKIHTLKTESVYFESLVNGTKKFELRKNDRDYKVGDWLHLIEYRDGICTGRKFPCVQIRFILHGGVYGLERGYCIVCW